MKAHLLLAALLSSSLPVLAQADDALALLPMQTVVAPNVNQEVTTTRTVFRNDGLVVTAGNTPVLDLTPVAKQKNATASAKIVSAVGNVVSVFVSTYTCAATCQTYEDYRAVDANAHDVSLAALVGEAAVLGALQQDPYLQRMMQLPQNAEVAERLARAKSLAEYADVLYNGFYTEDGRVALSSPNLSSFAIYGYDAAKNQLIVRVAMQIVNKDGSFFGPVLGMAFTPNAELAADLLAAKNGRGLLLNKR